MKRILLISNMYPSKKYPHYGVFIKNTEDILKTNNFIVNHAVMTKQDSFINKLFHYIVFYLSGILKSIFGRYDYLYAHYVSHTALLIKIIHFLKPHIKIVINVHGNDVVPEDDHDRKYIKMVKDIMPFVSLCICPSTYFRDIMINEYHLNSDIVKVFPSGGINFNTFQYNVNAKGKIGIPKDKKLIAYISRLEINKGWDTFIKAVRQLDNNKYSFVMIGNGDQYQEAKNLIDQYDLENVINLYDFKSQKELVDYYSACDYFVFPTTRKSESLGLVGLEAMACYCVVFASNMAGPTSYIENGENGFLFEPGNVENLVKLIENADNMDLSSIKENAYYTAKKYDMNEISYHLIEIFNEIC